MNHGIFYDPAHVNDSLTFLYEKDLRTFYFSFFDSKCCFFSLKNSFIPIKYSTQPKRKPIRKLD
ncbi:hypothetical protein BUQ74_12965 [Leptospira weilii serovar Heyan]|nr:hypothetical protein BUQ74_12965 [Leptospira weilii serovar Heyan]